MPNPATSDGLPLETPDTFSFPYEKPYEIQLALMRVCLLPEIISTANLKPTHQHVYSAIESRSAAVVESPTGTASFSSFIKDRLAIT